TMTVGALVKWLKKEGDPVKTGDVLAEVETDKATMELESFFDGTLLAVFVPAGSQVPIGAALCAVGKPGEKVSAPAPAAAPQSPAAPAAPQPSPSPGPAPARPPASARPRAPPRPAPQLGRRRRPLPPRHPKRPRAGAPGFPRSRASLPPKR